MRERSQSLGPNCELLRAQPEEQRKKEMLIEKTLKGTGPEVRSRLSLFCAQARRHPAY